MLVQDWHSELEAILDGTCQNTLHAWVMVILCIDFYILKLGYSDFFSFSLF